MNCATWVPSGRMIGRWRPACQEPRQQRCDRDDPAASVMYVAMGEIDHVHEVLRIEWFCEDAEEFRIRPGPLEPGLVPGNGDDGSVVRTFACAELVEHIEAARDR